MKLAFFILVANCAFAHFVGNPQAPAIPKEDFWLNATLECEREYMNNMNLEICSGRPTQRVEESNFSGNFLMLTANLWRSVNLYVKGGTAQPSFRLGNEETNAKTVPVWAVGAKWMLFRLERAAIALEASYLQTDPRHFQLFPVTNPSNTVRNEIHWYNWQISTALSYQICSLSPYIGVKFSRTFAFFKSLPSSLTLRNRRKFGLFLGCSLLAKRSLSLTIEGRVVDENSVSGTLGFRF